MERDRHRRRPSGAHRRCGRALTGAPTPSTPRPVTSRSSPREQGTTVVPRDDRRTIVPTEDRRTVIRQSHASPRSPAEDRTTRIEPARDADQRHPRQGPRREPAHEWDWAAWLSDGETITGTVITADPGITVGAPRRRLGLSPSASGRHRWRHHRVAAASPPAAVTSTSGPHHRSATADPTPQTPRPFADFGRRGAFGVPGVSEGPSALSGPRLVIHASICRVQVGVRPTIVGGRHPPIGAVCLHRADREAQVLGDLGHGHHRLGHSKPASARNSSS